jgi:S-adenosylmethionine:tRNA ribosyltransferase-isomerase
MLKTSCLPSTCPGRRPDIRDDVFVNLPRILPADSLLVFNNTKVVPRRLFFTKETGAHIEVFCLEPASPKEYILAFSQHASSVWFCAVGNAKKWKSGALPLYNPKNDPGIASLGLSATMIDKEGDRYLVRFRWSPDVPFSRVLELSGKVPIPPYLKERPKRLTLNDIRPFMHETGDRWPHLRPDYISHQGLLENYWKGK